MGDGKIKIWLAGFLVKDRAEEEARRDNRNVTEKYCRLKKKKEKRTFKNGWSRQEKDLHWNISLSLSFSPRLLISSKIVEGQKLIFHSIFHRIFCIPPPLHSVVSSGCCHPLIFIWWPGEREKISRVLRVSRHRLSLSLSN